MPLLVTGLGSRTVWIFATRHAADPAVLLARARRLVLETGAHAVIALVVLLASSSNRGAYLLGACVVTGKTDLPITAVLVTHAIVGAHAAAPRFIEQSTAARFALRARDTRLSTGLLVLRATQQETARKHEKHRVSNTDHHEAKNTGASPDSKRSYLSETWPNPAPE